jgi:hypothetical protein
MDEGKGNEFLDDFMNIKDAEEYERQLEALKKLRQDEGPPEDYPEYKGWQKVLYSAN